MNILILFRMGNPKKWRQAVAELEFALPRFAPDHNYLIHNASMPLPDFVKGLKFHGIILGPTFLCARNHPHEYAHRLKEYQFIQYSDAFKIALPQDDYDCSALLDRWVTQWRIDKVYTVCPDHWDILYPEYLKSGGKLVLGYTGYISKDLIKRASSLKALGDRKIDVCYRASRLPPNFGRLGFIKGEIGPRFQRAFGDQSLKLDISVDGTKMIPGSRWLDFIESARCTLGTNSGSSLLDPEGKIRKKVNSYLVRNPDATFEEVESVCFPGLDGKYIFTAISPRVLEAGLLKTGQIMIPGPYSDLISPWEHYIPLNEDCSNKEEVVNALKDQGFMERMTVSCKEALLSEPQIMMDAHVSNILSDIESGVTIKNVRSNDEQIVRAIRRHRVQMEAFNRFYWPALDSLVFISRRFPILGRMYRKFRSTCHI